MRLNSSKSCRPTLFAIQYQANLFCLILLVLFMSCCVESDWWRFRSINNHPHPHPDSHNPYLPLHDLVDDYPRAHLYSSYDHKQLDHQEPPSSETSRNSQIAFLSSDDFQRAQNGNYFDSITQDDGDEDGDPETSNSDNGYYEGDMMIQENDEEMIAKFMAKRWPHGRIPYAIEKGKFSSDERAAIARGMLKLHQKTCVRFVPKSDKDKNYVMIRKGGGCAAHVGRIGRGQQWLFLGRGCFGIETVVHELMHSVGFIHEQSRPDRDAHVKINWQNIKNEQKRNFRKHSTDYLADHGFPYDLMSAMHYRTHAFSKNKKATIIPRRPVPYLRCRGDGCPSQMDVQKINFLYKCNKGGHHGGRHHGGYNVIRGQEEKENDNEVFNDKDLFNDDDLDKDYGSEEDERLVRSWDAMDKTMNSPPHWWQNDNNDGAGIW